MFPLLFAAVLAAAPSPADRWQVELLDDEGRVVRAWTATAEPGSRGESVCFDAIRSEGASIARPGKERSATVETERVCVARAAVTWRQVAPAGGSLRRPEKPAGE